MVLLGTFDVSHVLLNNMYGSYIKTIAVLLIHIFGIIQHLNMYVQALSVQVRTEYAPNIPFYLGLLSP